MAVLHPETSYQRIQGFGGAFTEAAAINFFSMPVTQQQSILEAYFGKTGVYKNIYMCVCVYICVCVYMYIYVCVYTYMFVCMYVYIYIYVCVAHAEFQLRVLTSSWVWCYNSLGVQEIDIPCVECT